jgi:succinate dehydrogenase / fumarate reductase cytochrome b subunit
MSEIAIPSALATKRTHSLMGIWLTLFLMEHIFVNSQAAFFVGDDGKGFIKAANALEGIPYLQVIELLILGLPFAVHMIWGIKYALTAKYNSFGKTKISPYQPYARNKAYTWQRITSYLLVIGIIAHVVQMRFLDRPDHAALNNQNYYMVLVNLDDGIYTLAKRLDVQLYDSRKVQIQKQAFLKESEHEVGFFHLFFGSMKDIFSNSVEPKEKELEEQDLHEKENFLKTLEKHTVKPGQAIAISKDFGTAELLMLRETFKIPIMMAFYTLFVLASCFHGFNGISTFLFSWGFTATEKSRKLFLKISYGLMFLFAFLGLSAVWATYWINLYD